MFYIHVCVCVLTHHIISALFLHCSIWWFPLWHFYPSPVLRYQGAAGSCAEWHSRASQQSTGLLDFGVAKPGRNAGGQILPSLGPCALGLFMSHVINSNKSPAIDSGKFSQLPKCLKLPRPVLIGHGMSSGWSTIFTVPSVTMNIHSPTSPGAPGA